MTAKTKNFLFFLILTVVAAGASYTDLLAIEKYNNDIQNLVPPLAAPRRTAERLRNYQYVGKDFEIGFQYPQALSLENTGGVIALSHSIPFENHGACDMKGDDQAYPMLEDFHATIQVASGTVASAAKSISPYIPAENFAGDTLKVNPGFIDRASLGSFSGFAIYEGAEGCGHTIYYFPAGSGLVLVVTKDLVQALSGVMSSNIKEEILKIPGAISPEQSDAMFQKIIESLRLGPASNSANQTG